MGSGKKLSSTLVALSLGLFVIFLGSTASRLIEILFTRHLLLNLSPSEIKDLYNKDSFGYQIVIWVSLLVLSSTKVLGGYLVGVKVKSKGWVYGIILGIVWIIVTTAISLLYTLSFYKLKSVSYISQGIKDLITEKRVRTIVYEIPSRLLPTIALTALGGCWGEYRRKRLGKKIW